MGRRDTGSEEARAVTVQKLGTACGDTDTTETKSDALPKKELCSHTRQCLVSDLLIPAMKKQQRKQKTETVKRLTLWNTGSRW